MARPLRVLVLLVGLLLGGQLIAAAPAAAAPGPPPDVTGQVVSQARTMLDDWNPNVNVVVLPIGGDFPTGTDPELAVVVSQAQTDPATQASGAPPQIELSVLARVPDVVKLTQADADELIARSGLRSVPSPRTAPLDWIVLRQSPPAKTTAKWGEQVEIFLGPPPPVAVPDLRGQTEDQAKTTAAQAGLQLSVASTGSGTQGTLVVIQQDPAPGTQVAPGTTVRVELGASAPPSTGPPSPPPPPPPPFVSPTAAILTGGSLLVLLAVLLLVGLLLTRTMRRPSWVRDHVRTKLRAGGAATVRLEPTGTRPATTITVARRDVPPEIMVEEIHP